ncbi:MAG TPA: hypothetical protein VNJ08_01680 [Bacteriovoracaceae bacterium]|nr:hypothetical protein [Bacteriovoracaceae bacterium]
MRTILFLALIIPTLAHARKLKPIKLLENNKGVIFHSENDLHAGDELFVYTKKNKKLSFTSMLKITSCDIEQCEAKLVKMKKGTKLSLGDYYSNKNLQKPGSTNKNYGYVAVGSPLTLGLNLGYFKEWTNTLKLGGKVGIINAEIAKVGVSGNYLAVQLDSKLADWEKIEFNPYAEIGYLRTNLDFKKINGPKFDDNVPYLGFGLNVWKFWDRFFLLGKGGYSYNFYEGKYSEDGIADYTLPFKGGLIVFELGAGMSF